MIRWMSAAALLSAFAACDGAEEAPPTGPTPEEACPKVSMDNMSGQWIKFEGRAVKEYRFEIVEEGGSYTLWYTGGGFTKRSMKGEKRGSDVMFTEVFDAKRESMYKAGSTSKVRLYVEPRKKDCSLRVSEMAVEWKGDKVSERAKGTFTTFVEVPKGPVLTFRPCDEELFIGAAATDHAEMMAQVERSGAAEPAGEMGDAVPLGTWTDAAADGDAACTYDMDLYFDDTSARDKDGNVLTAVPAGEVADGKRHWVIPVWYAPWTGNHHFEAYRYKTCDGGSREVIGVSCLEAILQ
ncbi:MAG: hypothetical protein ACI8RZ_003279 [Myxococcota bacterium]|jgi:hypothetical protein